MVGINMNIYIQHMILTDTYDTFSILFDWISTRAFKIPSDTKSNRANWYELIIGYKSFR